MTTAATSGAVRERSLEDARILVVSHQYGLFTKAQVDELADRVAEVQVFPRYNRLGDLGNVLDLDALEGYGKADKVADDRPENVGVTPTPVTYLPIDSWYRRLGQHHYRSIERRLPDDPGSFDLVHSHFTWTAGYVGARLSEEYGIPSVLTVHENQDWLTEELESDNEGIAYALREQDAIIRVNEKDCDRLAEYNDHVHAIPNGFDRDRFPYIETETARRALDLPSDAAVVFSLGDLNPRKRFDHLIRAIEAVEYDGQLICAIGGRGGERESLERLASEVDADVRILGYLSDEELANWMNACDVFTLASEAEGNPTTMFEALGCGKPYVGTNVGGVDEIITDDRYGLYCDPDSRAELTAILEDALERSWDRDAILDYAEQFTWESIVEDVTDVYQSVWRDADRAAD